MQEYLSIFSSAQTREVLPLILIGISGVAFAIIFYLLIGIQRSITKNKIENNKLLEIIKAINESSQKLDRETTQANINLNSSYEILKTQVEALIQSSIALRGEFNQLQEMHQASVEEIISNAVVSNIQGQSEKLQVLEEKLEAFTQIIERIESLERKTSNLKNILLKIQENSHNSQEIITGLASKNLHTLPDETLQNLQTLSDKLTEIESYKTQTEALVKTTATEVENRIKKLLEVKKTKAKSTKKGMSPVK